MESIIKIASLAGQSVKEFARGIVPIVILDDESLVIASREGDDKAFGELVKRYQQFVIRQAYGYLGDSESAKDAAQDVFIKAYEGLPYLENARIFKSWLYRIGRNHCLNLVHRRKIEDDHRVICDSTSDPNTVLKVMVREKINRLDEKDREIIIMRYYQDLKYEEIAELLDIPLSSVKIRLYRAKQALKAILEGIPDEVR
jgi:RNA polymerase sigma-70 factor (ECF subfamily)